MRQSLHEHVGFIKMSEGYPQFIFKNASTKPEFKMSKKSEAIGVLDFYESLCIMPQVISAIERAVLELKDCHKPDNGLTSTCMELSAYKFLTSELMNVQNLDYIYQDKAPGMRFI